MIEKQGTNTGGAKSKRKLSQEENEKGIKDGFVPRNDTNKNSHSYTLLPIVTSQSQARTPPPPISPRSPAARLPSSSLSNGNDRNRSENTGKLPPPRRTVNREINPNPASVENNAKGQRNLTVQHANNHNDGTRDPNHNGGLSMPPIKGQIQSEIKSSSSNPPCPPSHSPSSDGQLYTQKLDAFLDKYEKKYGLEPLDSQVQADLLKTRLPLIPSLKTEQNGKIASKSLHKFSKTARPITAPSSTVFLLRKFSSRIPIPVPKTKTDPVKKEVDTPLASQSSHLKSPRICNDKSKSNDRTTEEEQQVQVHQRETTSAGKAEVVVIAPPSKKNHNNVSLKKPKLRCTLPIPKQIPLQIVKQMPRKAVKSSRQTDNSNKVISTVKTEPVPLPNNFIFKTSSPDEISACLELIDGLSSRTSGIIKELLEIPHSDQDAVDRFKITSKIPIYGDFFGAPYVTREMLGHVLFTQYCKRVQFGQL